MYLVPRKDLRPTVLPLAGGTAIRHNPGIMNKSDLKRYRRLKELAKWPSEAHYAWGRLDAVSRNLIVLQMASNYGVDFASEFLKEVAKGRSRDIVQHYFGRSVGPMPSKLRARGYRLAQKDSIHEWWVHPSGKSVVRNYSEDQPSTTGTRAEQKRAKPLAPKSRPQVCKEVDLLAERICQNSERICKIAMEVDDQESRADCKKARATCEGASQRGRACGDRL